MLFGKLFTNPKMWVNGDADEITMGGVYTCKDVQNVPTGDGALFVFKTENTVKQVFIPVGEEGVVYTRVLGEEWASVTGTSEETQSLIQSAIDKANQAQAKADTVDTRLNNIIVESGTSDAEVVAARTDSSGQTFTTLGVRLDTQFSEIKEDLNNNAVSMKGEIDNNASLNDYTVPGVYWHGSTRTVMNIPEDLVTSDAFVLIVYKADTAVYKTAQMLITYGSVQRFYSRAYASTSEWSGWARFATKSELSNDIGELSNDIGELFAKNYFSSDLVTSGGYFDSSGAIIQNNASEYTDYIAIDNAKAYTLTNTKAHIQICTYDERKNFLSRPYNQSALQGITFDIGVRYVRISIFEASFGTGFVFAESDKFEYVQKNGHTILSPQSLGVDAVKTANIENASVTEGKTTFFTISSNVLNPNKCQKDKWLDGKDGIKTQNGCEISGYIPVTAGDVVHFTPQSALYIGEFIAGGSYTRTQMASTASSYTVINNGSILFARYGQYFDDEFMVTINAELPTHYEEYGSYKFDYYNTEFEEEIENRIEVIKEQVAKAKITKTSTQIRITKGNVFYDINKYNNTSIRANLWRTNNCWYKDGSAYVRIWYDSDSDGVVQLHGEDDFLGGYHGDEIMTSFHLFIDGVPYAESDTFADLEFEQMVLVCESDVYHCNTSSEAENVCFKRVKNLIFNKDGLTVNNYWTAQEAVEVNTAYMGMLSVQRFTDSGHETYLINGYETNANYKYCDAETGTAITRDLTKATIHTIYGDFGIVVNSAEPSSAYCGYVADYDGSGGYRLKVYTGPFASHLNLSVGDVIKGSVTYTYN